MLLHERHLRRRRGCHRVTELATRTKVERLDRDREPLGSPPPLDPRPWQLAAIRDTCASPDADWRTIAVFCVPSFDELADLAVAALADPDEGVRAQAVATVAGMGQLSVADVARLLAAKDTPRAIRLAAVGALGSLGGPHAREALKPFLASRDPERRRVAEGALDDIELLTDLDGEEVPFCGCGGSDVPRVERREERNAASRRQVHEAVPGHELVPAPAEDPIPPLLRRNEI